MSSLGPRIGGCDSSDGELNHLILSAGFNDPSALTASPSGFDGSFIGKKVLRVSSGSRKGEHYSVTLQEKLLTFLLFSWWRIFLRQRRSRFLP